MHWLIVLNVWFIWNADALVLDCIQFQGRILSNETEQISLSTSDHPNAPLE